MRGFKIVALIVLAALLAVPVSAQTNGKAHGSPQLDCTQCHTCAQPTVSAPCLKQCPRIQAAHKTSQHALTDAPDSMVLDDLADLYEPVRFNHKLHAGMAEMGSDCSTCHHYSPSGHIPPCKECHSPAGESSDLRKPNLKGAYHRQCLACHREWSHETQCILCHIPKAGSIVSSPSDPTDIVGIAHPVITVPVTKVYDTPYKTAAIVTFQHKEHIELFGLRCVDCHRQENCGNCHDLQKQAVKRTQEEVHAVCNDCHKQDACSKCHDKKQRPGFTHAKTGWALNRFHEKLDCRACHPTGKRIAKLNSACGNCHGGWNQQNFMHAVTGLKLDEVHGEADCTSCHVDRQYDKPPSCAECHDDGRDHKAAPPGEYVKKNGRS